MMIEHVLLLLGHQRSHICDTAHSVYLPWLAAASVHHRRPQLKCCWAGNGRGVSVFGWQEGHPKTPIPRPQETWPAAAPAPPTTRRYLVDGLHTKKIPWCRWAERPCRGTNAKPGCLVSGGGISPVTLCASLPVPPSLTLSPDAGPVPPPRSQLPRVRPLQGPGPIKRIEVASQHSYDRIASSVHAGAS